VKFVEDTITRSRGMIGNAAISPEVRRAFYKQLEDNTADPAVIASVSVGMELVLDILQEEMQHARERGEIR
jgi:hypothetical protein